MSPIRPMIGVATAALRNGAVSSHVAAVAVVCRSSARLRRAGATSEVSTVYASPASVRTANVRL
jgi:hypothetical protein